MNDVNVYRGTPEELPAQWRKRAERKRLCGLSSGAELDEAHANELEAALALQPARGDGAVDRREEDRARFSHPAFNRWLDEGISDGGHTVYDYIGHEGIPAAWAGWEAREHYAPSAAVGGRVGEEPEERAPDCLECGATWKEAHHVDCSSNAANLP